jgi:hypothetical protein
MTITTTGAESTRARYKEFKTMSTSHDNSTGSVLAPTQNCNALTGCSVAKLSQEILDAFDAARFALEQLQEAEVEFETQLGLLHMAVDDDNDVIGRDDLEYLNGVEDFVDLLKAYELWRCPRCNNKAEEQQKFCANCGNALMVQDE